MGNIVIQYIKQESFIMYTCACQKSKHLISNIYNRMIRLGYLIISTFRQSLCNKFVRLGMLFPMFMLLLSGFIEEDKNSLYGEFSQSEEQLYPLTQNFMPIVPVPNSGVIPINHEVGSFFTQYEKNENGRKDFRNIPDTQLNTRKAAITHLNNKSSNTTRNTNYIVLQDSMFTGKQVNALLPTPLRDVTVATPSYIQRKNTYTPYAISYARKYGLDPKMVISIIYAESIFFPHLISNRNAHGLMQVVPATAGAEVHSFFKKEGEPSSADLMHPETNIRYGTAYLFLLRRYHLVGINNPKIKDILTIASYNAGSGAVLRHFAKSRTDAIEKINSMSEDEIITTILTSYRSTETRRYLQKVLSYMASI